MYEFFISLSIVNIKILSFTQWLGALVLCMLAASPWLTFKKGMKPSLVWLVTPVWHVKISALHRAQNDYSLRKKCTVARPCVAIESRVNTQSLKVKRRVLFCSFQWRPHRTVAPVAVLCCVSTKAFSSSATAELKSRRWCWLDWGLGCLSSFKHEADMPGAGELHPLHPACSPKTQPPLTNSPFRCEALSDPQDKHAAMNSAREIQGDSMGGCQHITETELVKIRRHVWYISGH